MARRPAKSSEEIDALYLKAKAEIDAGAKVKPTLEKYDLNDPAYYGRKAKENKATKKVAKKVSKKATRKSKKVSFVQAPVADFSALDNPKGGKTMIIVTDDKDTVANIMLAAFGRGA